MNEQQTTIEELWIAIGRAVWEKYLVEKQLAEAVVKIQELSGLLREKENNSGTDSTSQHPEIR